MHRRKEKLDVVFDVDGCLADFEMEFCERFGYRHREYVNLHKRYPEHTDQITKFIEDRNTYVDLRPVPVGMDIVRWLGRRTHAFGVYAPRANIEIVSARPYRMAEITKQWLRKNHVPYRTLTVQPDKENYILSRQPDILVDDIIDVCSYIYSHMQSVTPVLIAHPWNEGSAFFPRVTSLGEFQLLYEAVAREKLLSDLGGTGMAQDLPDTPETV